MGQLENSLSLTPQTRTLATPLPSLAPSQWQQQLNHLVCVERWQETADVVSFRFQAGEPMCFDYKPGQFMTFVLDINGEQLCRSYTLSSSPSRPYSLMVTIKRVNGGRVSNYLIDHLQPGHTVQVFAPTGLFNLFDIPAKKYLFLSAGCGITPMYSMSRYLTDTQMEADIAFVHSARSSDDIIFKDNLAAMAQRHHAFKLSYALESAIEAASSAVGLSTHSPHPEISYDEGRLTAQMLRSFVPDFAERTIYLCGPAPYMQAVTALLESLNFDMQHLHQESFTAVIQGEHARLQQATATDAQSGPFMLTIGDRARAMSAEQSLLEGIEAEGLPIIAACRSGVCGACKCQVLEGETRSTSQMTLTEADIAAGFVLACSTTLASDVKLQI